MRREHGLPDTVGMRLAEQAAGRGGKSVALIALSGGYTSESAFSDAFKRATGKSPKSYRDNNARKRSLTQLKGM